MRPHPGWPAELSAGPSCCARHGCATRGVERDPAAQREWLSRGNRPRRSRGPSGTRRRRGRRCVSALRKAARSGTMLPFMIIYGGRLVGQINVSNIVHGVLRSCTIGYWVDGALAGRGIVPTALALADRPLLRRGRAAPRRDRHPAGEHRQPARRREARPAARGLLRALTSTSTAAGATTSRSRSPSRSCRSDDAVAAGRRCRPPPHLESNASCVRTRSTVDRLSPPRAESADWRANLSERSCDWCDWRCEMLSPMMTVVVLAVLWLDRRRPDDLPPQRRAPPRIRVRSRRSSAAGHPSASAGAAHAPPSVRRSSCSPTRGPVSALRRPPSRARRPGGADVPGRRARDVRGARRHDAPPAPFAVGTGRRQRDHVLLPAVFMGGAMWVHRRTVRRRAGRLPLFLRTQALRDRERRASRQLRAADRPSARYDATRPTVGRVVPAVGRAHRRRRHRAAQPRHDRPHRAVRATAWSRRRASPSADAAVRRASSRIGERYPCLIPCNVRPNRAVPVSGLWRSPVAHLVRIEGVRGSNPLSSTYDPVFLGLLALPQRGGATRDPHLTLTRDDVCDDVCGRRSPETRESAHWPRAPRKR